MGALAWPSCSRKADLDEVFEPPRSLEASGVAPGSPSEFVLEPGSQLDFSFGSRQRRVRGHVALARGELTLNPMALSTTRGWLSFDLATTEVVEDAPTASNASLRSATGGLTEQSLRWLQVAEPDSLVQPQLRYARFSISSVGALSADAAFAGQVVQAPSAATALRRVRLRVTGELELHGFRLPYTVPLIVTFGWSEPTPGNNPPRSIEIVTAEALDVDLIAHGIAPRDARGEVLGESLAELRKPPSNKVEVSARWVARLTPLPGASSPGDRPPH